MPEPVTIIYIASLGHSGSTLLDLMLSSHSEVVSVGEVCYLYDYTNGIRQKDEVHHFGSECTCGAETVWQCPFWTEVDRVIKRSGALGLRDLELRTPDDAQFREHNRLLFEGVAQVSGKRYIVDSSKAAARLRRLRDAGIADVRPVHLMRHQRGSVYSHLRRRKESRRPLDILDLSLRYAYHTLRLRRMLRGTDAVRIRYERLVEHPREHLERIMRHVGLGFEEEQLRWAGRERHNLGGNKMRRTTDSTLRLDTSWREGLEWYQAGIVDLVTLPSRIGLG